MNNEPIVIERTLNAALPVVWRAITDLDDMKQWFIKPASFRPEVGFEFQFLEGSEEKKYLHLCRITEVVVGKKISYTWRYDGYAGNTLVTFELFAEGDKTRVKLTHAGVDTFPASNPELSKDNHKEGWTYLVGTALKKFVEKS